MIRHRIIPVLLIQDGSLVKTIKFSKPDYLGDPVNTVRIFNEKMADELVILDISASKKGIDFELLKEISSECFMPLSYGGGIKSIDEIKKLFEIGFEKVILNTFAYKNKSLLEQAINYFGKQSIVVSIDVKKNLFGKYKAYVNRGKEKIPIDPIDYFNELQEIGVGEIIINNISKDGTMSGYDLDMLKEFKHHAHAPVVALGGAGTKEDIKNVLELGFAAAAGSLFVYHGKHRALLISYLDADELTS